MRVLESSFWGLLASAAIAQAGPCNPSAAVCSQIKHLLGSDATPVCSSYLGPRLATVTVTATSVHTNLETTTLPPPTQSTTLEVTTTVFVTSEETRYSQNPTQTQVETVTAPAKTIYRYRPAGKRDALNPVLHSLEMKYSESMVTAGCNCVYEPSTETVTSTASVIEEATQQLTSGPVTTVVVTETQYVPVTQEVDVTITVGPTNTDTVQAKATVIPDPVVRPAICNARGLPGVNAFNYYANFNTNQNACISACKTDSRCLATGFYLVTDPSTGQTTGTCRYYDKSVTDSADLGFGYYNFNDMDCQGPA
ncbi:hypothetical protein G7Z17_g10962 [Cylindrodendrum hubeiense]|uniref:Apple domain-containing protein n=1 Tax=Cylindrodendrum hubeiense TaxID=595255 RepID=A0A9P5L6T8_9HYPO|nr:hypothetical protein G7Z17_g10962 [Cylindrodendrum hubeiense]